MNLPIPKIIEYFQAVQQVPTISIAEESICKLIQGLQEKTIPKFDAVVLGTFDRQKEEGYYHQEKHLQEVYSTSATHTSSYLLPEVERKRLTDSRGYVEESIIRLEKQINHDYQEKGEECTNYKLRRTALHAISSAQEELQEAELQMDRSLMLLLFDCSAHFQTEEKKLYLAKALLEARIEEVTGQHK